MDVEKKEPLCTVGGIVNCYRHCGKQYGVSSTYKFKNILWASNSISRNIAKGNENTNWKKYLHPHVRSSTVCDSQDMETIQASINGWMDKEVVVAVCLCMMHYSAIKKWWNFTICNNTDGRLRHYAKCNRSDRRQTLHVITYRWNLKKKTKQTLNS